MASNIPKITSRITAAIQPTIHVKTAWPVEKSNACLTAITMAANPQTHTMKEMSPPKIGIKLRIRRTPGEFENPSVLSSS